MTMKLIQTLDVTTTGVASVVFSNIPQTGYTDLFVHASARQVLNNGIGWADAGLQYNGSTTGYTGRYIYHGSAGVGQGVEGAGYIPIRISNAPNTTGSFGVAQIYIPNYTVAVNKSALVDSVTENNSTITNPALGILQGNMWGSTAAITSLNFFCGEFVVGTRISLYGITSGSGGATVS